MSNTYSILPTIIRRDPKLQDGAKLLFCDITSLVHNKGFCYASNQYLSEISGVHPRTISKWVTSLKDRGYIKIEIEVTASGTRRKLFLTKKATVDIAKRPEPVKTESDSELPEEEGGSSYGEGGVAPTVKGGSSYGEGGVAPTVNLLIKEDKDKKNNYASDESSENENGDEVVFRGKYFPQFYITRSKSGIWIRDFPNIASEEGGLTDTLTRCDAYLNSQQEEGKFKPKKDGHVYARVRQYLTAVEVDAKKRNRQKQTIESNIGGSI